MWKKLVKDYFTLNQKDRIGAIAILFLISLAWALPHFFPKRNGLFLEENRDLLVKSMDTAVSIDTDVETTVFAPSQSEPVRKTAERFHFDPNTIDAAGWQRLGLPERVVNTIIKYRSKGGRFRRSEDLQKIWSLPEGFYESVKDYIRIPQAEENSVAFTASADAKPFVRNEPTPSFVSINEADTSAWIALPGIGSKLAARIVNFRDRLGGFYSVDQVGETYGLPDSTFQKIKNRLVLRTGVRKMNINTVSKEELKGHLYIRWQLANAIVEYRNQHGAFTSLEELKKIALIDEATFAKIIPYLTL
jgi:competence ComEA-like helix-hairpin-helix protein